MNGDKTFIYTGYSNWKCARGKEGGLQVHHMSSKHKDATLSWRQYQSTVANDSTIINHLEAGRLKKIQDNRQYVMYLLEVILCCSQQGLALRGHREVKMQKKQSTLSTSGALFDCIHTIFLFCKRDYSL